MGGRRTHEPRRETDPDGIRTRNQRDLYRDVSRSVVLTMTSDATSDTAIYRLTERLFRWADIRIHGELGKCKWDGHEIDEPDNGFVVGSERCDRCGNMVSYQK